MSNAVAEAPVRVVADRQAEGFSGELSFGDLMSLAKELVPTGFLPKHITTPGQCVAIIMTGRELGMQPMRALRTLHMVQGKVVESADSQLARFKAAGGRAKFVRLDQTVAELWLRHPNGDEHTEVFGSEHAKAAGLTGGNYSKYPQAMYRSRAITAGLKSVGWDGCSGAYDPDELIIPDDNGSPRAAAIVDTDPMPAEIYERNINAATTLDALKQCWDWVNHDDRLTKEETERLCKLKDSRKAILAGQRERQPGEEG